MGEMEKEYSEITALAEQLWDLKQQLKDVETLIEQKTFYWVVGPDGLVDLGMGMVL